MARGWEGSGSGRVQLPRTVQESETVRGHIYKSLEGTGHRSLGWFKILHTVGSDKSLGWGRRLGGGKSMGRSRSRQGGWCLGGDISWGGGRHVEGDRGLGGEGA